jgi:hypothetical protein
MNWSQESVKKLAESLNQQFKSYCKTNGNEQGLMESLADEALSVIAELPEVKTLVDRLLQARDFVPDAEAKYLSEEIKRLNAAHATFRQVTNERADRLKRQVGVLRDGLEDIVRMKTKVVFGGYEIEDVAETALKALATSGKIAKE